MELLLSTIYAANGDTKNSYKHLVSYVHLYTGPIYLWDFDNVLISYKGSMTEIIRILENKLNSEKEGIVKDSYFETLAILEKREIELQDISEETPSN